jgi:hypothetical protein
MITKTKKKREKLIIPPFQNAGKYQIPIVYKQEIDINGAELCGFPCLRKGDNNVENIIIHFFVEDDRFEYVHEKLQGRLSQFQKSRAVITIDCSLWKDMAFPLDSTKRYRQRKQSKIDRNQPTLFDLIGEYSVRE